MPDAASERSSAAVGRSDQAVELAAFEDRVSRQPLSFLDKSLFSAGDIVDGTINFGIAIFIFYYLTAVCGLSGTVAGGLLALSTVIDAFADPLIGSISDNTRTRYGRRLPYMLIAAFPMALTFALLFSVPASLRGWLLPAYVGLILLVGRLSMSFFFLPYAAASAELSADYTERSVLFAYRTFLNCVGNVILLVLGYWVFMHGREGLLSRGAYAGFGWTVGAIALAAAMTSTFSTYSQRDRLRVSFARLAGYAAAVPLSTWLLRWFEKRDVALIGLALMSGVQLLPAPMRIAGLLPDGEALYDILGVVAFLGGVAGTCGFVSCGSMMSDAVDEHELLFGPRWASPNANSSKTRRFFSPTVSAQPTDASPGADVALPIGLVQDLRRHRCDRPGSPNG